MSEKISIILCTYNEVNFIEQTIVKLRESLPGLQIIIVDDNSKDGTIDILKKYESTDNIKIIYRLRSRGLASAFCRGLIETSRPNVGWLDTNMNELTTRFNEMNQMLTAENDLIILSRYVNGGGDERDSLRVYCSKYLNFLCRLILSNKIKDYTSSIFIMKRSIINEATLLGYGHGEFFIEFLYQVEKKGFIIKELPYVQKKDSDITNSKSAPNIFKYFFLGFFYVIRIFFARFRRF